MSIRNKPLRWQGSDEAIKAVQIAFDVEEAVLQAVRKAAFDNNLSTPDQIRQILALPISSRPKRPRLTVSLGPDDYGQLAQRYGLDKEDRLQIKERVTMDLIAFAKSQAA